MHMRWMDIESEARKGCHSGAKQSMALTVMQNKECESITAVTVVVLMPHILRATVGVCSELTELSLGTLRARRARMRLSQPWREQEVLKERRPVLNSDHFWRKSDQF
jgi:hypothetical protein